MSGRTAVLFDLDGVLVDSRTTFARCVNDALRIHGQPQRREQDLHRYLGPPLHQTFRALVVDDSLVQPCVERYRERYRAYAATESTVFPGIRTTLEELSGRLLLVVATSKPGALAAPLLGSLALASYFIAVVGPDLATEHEEKAVTIARAREKLPADARPIMVGDRSHDVIGARTNAIPCIGVAWGIGSEAELVEAGADRIVRRPEDLAEAIETVSANTS